MSSPATARRQPDPAPLADAASPLQQGAETRVLLLALLLRLSLGIVLLPALLPALLLALVAALAARRRHVGGLWYLSPARQDEIASLSPRVRRAVARLLAIIGWALAGHRNRGMRPRAPTRRGTASGHRPICGPRAPPCPA